MRRLVPGFLILLSVMALPARAAVNERRFVVFFTQWSAAFDRGATAVIADAAKWIVAHPDASITVTGAADLTGGRKANQLLSELRAQVVADLLAQDGVPASRLKLAGVGSVGYALSSQESRRAIITVTAQ